MFAVYECLRVSAKIRMSDGVHRIHTDGPLRTSTPEGATITVESLMSAVDSHGVTSL